MAEAAAPPPPPAQVPVETVASDFATGRCESERSTGKGSYPGAAHKKAAKSLLERRRKSKAKEGQTGAAYWQGFEGVGPTIAAEIAAYLARKGLSEAHITRANCAHLYGGSRGDLYVAHETPWSYKMRYYGNQVTSEGEKWAALVKAEASAAKRAENKAAKAAAAAAIAAAAGGEAGGAVAPAKKRKRKSFF